MSSPSLATLPALPLEVKHAILRFCGQQELVDACVVSLAFLELAGPLLYSDVTIKGPQHLTKLVRDADTPASLAGSLSLSHLRKLTYYPKTRQGDRPLEDLTIALFPLPHKLDSLTIDFAGCRKSPGWGYTKLATINLLRSLNPAHYTVKGQKKPGVLLSFLGTEDWSRLTKLDLHDLVCEDAEALFETSRARPLDVVYDDAAQSPKSTLHCIRAFLEAGGQGALGEVLVRVKGGAAGATMAQPLLLFHKCARLVVNGVVIVQAR